jgi:hypothetical protein
MGGGRWFRGKKDENKKKDENWPSKKEKFQASGFERR